MLLNEAGCTLFQIVLERNPASPGVNGRNPTDFKEIGVLTLVFLCEVSLKDSPGRKENTPCASLRWLPSVTSFFWDGLQRDQFHWLGNWETLVTARNYKETIPLMSHVSDQEGLVRGTDSCCSLAWRVSAETGAWVSMCGRLGEPLPSDHLENHL